MPLMKDPTFEPTKPVAFRLSKSVPKKLNTRALKLGVSRNRLVEAILREYIDHADAERDAKVLAAIKQAEADSRRRVIQSREAKPDADIFA